MTRLWLPMLLASVVVLTGANWLVPDRGAIGSVSLAEPIPPGVKPTGGLDFFPSKVPIEVSTDTASIQSVRIEGLENVNGCACITFADGTRATTINGRPIYKITFKKLVATSPVHLRAVGEGYSLTIDDPAAGLGDVVLGGLNARGEAMNTEVFGTLNSISITPFCLINWASLAGLGSLLDFGISAIGFCARFTAYAVRAYDPSPNPDPRSNPVLLPAASFNLTSS